MLIFPRTIRLLDLCQTCSFHPAQKQQNIIVSAAIFATITTNIVNFIKIIFRFKLTMFSTRFRLGVLETNLIKTVEARAFTKFVASTISIGKLQIYKCKSVFSTSKKKQTENCYNKIYSSPLPTTYLPATRASRPQQ